MPTSYLTPLKKFSEFVATYLSMGAAERHLPNQCLLLLFLCIVVIVGRRKDDVIGTNQLSIKAKYKCLQLLLLFFFSDRMALGSGKALGKVDRKTVCLIRQPFWCRLIRERRIFSQLFRYNSPPQLFANPPFLHRCCLTSSHFHTRTATATATSSHRYIQTLTVR